MKKTFIWIGSVIGAAAVMALAFGAIERRATPNTITVTGECLTSVKKDKTAITLRVTTLAPTTIESMTRATEQAKLITEKLKTMPVEMQTTQFNSYEKSEWNRDLQKSETLGIETTIAIEISAGDEATIEKVLTEFAGMPDIYTENLRMYSGAQLLKKAQEECMAGAVENARDRANALMIGVDKRAGKILSVTYGASSSGDAVPTNLLRSKMVTVAAAMDTGGTIVAKDTDVTVTVTAVFEIK